MPQPFRRLDVRSIADLLMGASPSGSRQPLPATSSRPPQGCGAPCFSANR